MAAVHASGSVGARRNPERRSSTSSGNRPTSVATTGTPAAYASNTRPQAVPHMNRREQEGPRSLEQARTRAPGAKDCVYARLRGQPTKVQEHFSRPFPTRHGPGEVRLHQELFGEQPSLEMLTLHEAATAKKTATRSYEPAIRWASRRYRALAELCPRMKKGL
jgi:hypothetical protein